MARIATVLREREIETGARGARWRTRKRNKRSEEWEQDQ